MTTAPERAREQRDALGEPSDLRPGGQVGRPVLRYGGDARLGRARSSRPALPRVAAFRAGDDPVGCADLSASTEAARAIPCVRRRPSAAELPRRAAFRRSRTPTAPCSADGRFTTTASRFGGRRETLARPRRRARRVVYTGAAGVYSLDAALADARTSSDPLDPPGPLLSEPTGSRTRTTPGATSRRRGAHRRRVENAYTFRGHPLPDRPCGTVVVPNRQRPRLYSPVQHPYLLQRTIASVIGLPLNQVRVFAPDPGGGFGGKQNPKLEPLIAFLALRTRRACRIVLSLEETFQSMRRAGCRMTARTGFTRTARSRSTAWRPTSDRPLRRRGAARHGQAATWRRPYRIPGCGSTRAAS